MRSLVIHLLQDTVTYSRSALHPLYTTYRLHINTKMQVCAYSLVRSNVYACMNMMLLLKSMTEYPNIERWCVRAPLF